ncbi:putative F-box protein At3g52320 [Rutidosis leptorrhynchoides]|uniref:putative F-box protein At3g52320 n=1 Tax=Rutidosis leptorrhynchoides TaxID=125765 RepID=UPI003A9A1E11
MSDHIPFEIQIEIMNRFPVKSLMRFRSVSKPWKSLIDSSGFVSDYGLRQTQPHLFLVYIDPHEINMLRYVSIVDDDTFPHNFKEKMCDMSSYIPKSLKLVGSSQGLLCFLGSYYAFICNPSIRKSIEFISPDLINVFRDGIVFGFGVCPKSSEPKLVKITVSENPLETQTWTVVVFLFKTWCSRSFSFSKIGNLLCKSLNLSSSNECVDGFIYWCAYNTDDAIWVVISFDVTNEEFGVIHLPDSLARYKYMDLCKYRESIVLITHDYNISEYDYDVWMMESGGVTKSFKKLFTINSSYDCVKMMAISYNGVGILETEDYVLTNFSSISTYEPSSYRFKDTTITGIYGSYSMSSYMETMLLHDY